MPLREAINNAICEALLVNNLDQRGVARPTGSGCDIGAVEFDLLVSFLPLIIR